MAARKDELRIGMVGCGSVSHAHGQAAAKVDGVRLTAVCDVLEDRAHERAADYGCDAAYTDIRDMLSGSDLDAVLLATWPTFHHQHIDLVLEAGIKHILCEKPLCITGREASEIVALVESAGGVCMEAFMYRHYPWVDAMHAALADQTYGRVDCIKADYSMFDAEPFAPDNPNRGWRRTKELCGGMPYDHACYCVNACGLFAGSLPVRVFAAGSRSARYDTISRMFGMIEYENGAVGMIESSKDASGSRELQVVCESGRLTVPTAWLAHGHPMELRETAESRWENGVKTTTFDNVDPYELQLANFADACRGRERPRVPLRESAVNIHVVEALVESFERQRPIEVELPPALTH